MHVTGAGLAFDVSSLLPEAAEALLDRAAAGLADHLAAAAEPFLTAAQWAALANRELAGDPAGGAPRNGPSPCGARPRPPLAHRSRLLLAAGDLDAAVALARRARSLGLAVLASPPAPPPAGPSATPSSTPSAERSPPDPTRLRIRSKAALDTLALARELGIDPDLDRAQELVYDTVRSSDRPDLDPLADGLGLSPALFDARRPKPSAPPEFRDAQLRLSDRSERNSPAHSPVRSM